MGKQLELFKQDSEVKDVMNIADKTTEDGASVQMTVIMKLLEGTDFTMSFSMN